MPCLALLNVACKAADTKGLLPVWMLAVLGGQLWGSDTP